MHTRMHVCNIPSIPSLYFSTSPPSLPPSLSPSLPPSLPHSLIPSPSPSIPSLTYVHVSYPHTQTHTYIPVHYDMYMYVPTTTDSAVKARRPDQLCCVRQPRQELQGVPRARAEPRAAHAEDQPRPGNPRRGGERGGQAHGEGAPVLLDGLRETAEGRRLLHGGADACSDL